MAQSRGPFRAALGLVRDANGDLLARKRLALSVMAISVGPGFLVAATLQIISSYLVSGSFGSTFFDPGGHADPLWLQHLIWFLGHPETIYLILGLAIFILATWGSAIWWRSQGGAIRVRVPWRGFLIIMALLWLPAAVASMASYATFTAFYKFEFAGLLLGVTYNVVATAICFSMALALVSAARGLPVSLAVAWNAARQQGRLILYAALAITAIDLGLDAVGVVLGGVWQDLPVRLIRPDNGVIRYVPFLSVGPIFVASIVSGWLLALNAAIIWRIAKGTEPND